MEIRLINKQEINEVMVIINDAKKLLSKDSLQWQQGYPNEETMLLDVENNSLFGAYLNNELVGIVALVLGTNPYYINIYDGSWITPANEKDLVIHRIAVKENYHHQKVGDSLMKFAETYAKDHGCISLKADTHIKNLTMQHLLTFNDYQYRGVILLGRDEIDNSRLAYEKLIK